MDDNKFWMTVVLGLAVIFWAGIIGTCEVRRRWDKQYIDGGYERGTVHGWGQPVWVKAQSK